MSKRLLFSLIYCISHQLSAQYTAMNNYTTADGLPSSEVYEVYQDKKGFIWFGTDNGISRFDGSQFENFHVNDGLTDPVVFGFQEMEDGNVWFRTYSGRLCYMKPDGTIEHYKYNHLLAPMIDNGLLHFTYFSDKKELWFSVRNTVGRIDSAGNLSVEKVKASVDESAVLWKTINNRPLIVQTYAALKINHIEVDGTVYPIKIPAPNYINKVFRTLYWKNDFYYSFFNYLLRFDGKTLKLVYHSPHPIISITTDAKDNLWVGYLNKGVDCFTDTTFEKKFTLEAFANKSVTCVRQAADGAFWISTLENGVFVIPNMDIKHYDIPVDQKIKTVCAGKKYVVLADKSGQVRFYNPATKTIVKEISFQYDVLVIFADRHDNYWVSGHAMVKILNSDLQEVKTFSDMNVGDLVQLPNTDTVLAISSQRFYRFDSALNMAPDWQVSLEIYRQLAVHDNKLYLISRSGVAKRELDFKNPLPIKDLDGNKFSDILSLNDSVLFLPTKGNGFFLLNTKSGTLKHYWQNNFIADNIHATARLGDELWLGTDKGLSIVHIPSLLDGTLKLRHLNNKSGLKGRSVNFLAVANGEIWAVAEDVISVIPATAYHFAESRPKFYVKELKCNDRKVDLSKPMNFGPEENNLNISFGFISFTNDDIFHRYRVNEQEPWIYSTDRVAQFTSLAPGQYNFNLQYSTDNFNWTDATALIPFEIAAPWYRRWYFYPLAFFLLMGIALAYVRNRQAVYREKNEFLKIINEHQQKLIQSEITAIERERNRIAKELHDGVGTNLTAIKLSVRQLLHQHREPLADDIEEQFQIAISEIKDIIYDLTPPSLERYGLFTAFKNYINRIGKNIPISITVKTFGQDVSNFNLNIIVFRILQELLSNSIKHSQAKNITVHLNTFEDLLNIVYEDDGVGFTYDPIQSGLGLNNVESRIRSLNGTLKFDSGNFGVSYNIDIPLTDITKKIPNDAD